MSCRQCWALSDEAGSTMSCASAAISPAVSTLLYTLRSPSGACYGYQHRGTMLCKTTSSCDTTGWKSCYLYTVYTEKKRQNTLNWLQLSFLPCKQVPVLSYSINSWCISCSVFKSCTLLAGRVVLGLAWRHRHTTSLTYNSDVLKCGEKWAPLGKMENETRCHKYWETEETRSDPLDDSMEAAHVQRQ